MLGRANLALKQQQPEIVAETADSETCQTFRSSTQDRQDNVTNTGDEMALENLQNGLFEVVQKPNLKKMVEPSEKTTPTASDIEATGNPQEHGSRVMYRASPRHSASPSYDTNWSMRYAVGKHHRLRFLRQHGVSSRPTGIYSEDVGTWQKVLRPQIRPQESETPSIKAQEAEGWARSGKLAIESKKKRVSFRWRRFSYLQSMITKCN